MVQMRHKSCELESALSALRAHHDQQEVDEGIFDSF